MSEEDAIRRVLALYCQLCDDGRFDEWGELFTEDTRFTVLGHTHEGRDDAKAWMAQVQAPEHRGKHFLGQSVVDFDGDRTTATGVTDYTFVSRDPDGGYSITSAGRYHDLFVRSEDGQWRIASREIRFLGS